MDIHALSQQMLESALDSGTIVLGNGTTLTLTVAQILSIARYVLTSTATRPEQSQVAQAPSEMWAVEQPVECIDYCPEDQQRSVVLCGGCKIHGRVL